MAVSPIPAERGTADILVIVGNGPGPTFSAAAPWQLPGSTQAWVNSSCPNQKQYLLQTGARGGGKGIAAMQHPVAPGPQGRGWCGACTSLSRTITSPWLPRWKARGLRMTGWPHTCNQVPHDLTPGCNSSTWIRLPWRKHTQVNVVCAPPH